MFCSHYANLFMMCFYLILLVTGVFAEQAVPIRIGATVSLEGKYAEPSRMLQDGFRLWEKHVNETGGLLGRPVELILHDDKGSEELVRSLYEQMITEEKVDLVLAPYGSPLTKAAAEVTTRNGYFLLACGASANLWNGRFKNFYGMWAPGSRYFIGLLDIIASNGLNSVAIVYENSPFCADLANGTHGWARRFGLEVALFRSYESGKRELPRLLDEVQRVNPDCLILASYPEDSYFTVELMKDHKYRPRVVGLTIASTYPDFYLNSGSMAEGIFGSSQWEPDERIPFPGSQRFVSDFFQFTGKPPTYHSGSAYAGCQIIEKAIRHCQSLDQNKIADFIGSLDTATVVGRFKVDHDGSQTGHNPVIIQWQNGKKEIVFPLSMQTAQPRL
ncbi:MAG: amino acid ABC transporter substrate-binding protein [Syntrophobacter sp.]